MHNGIDRAVSSITIVRCPHSHSITMWWLPIIAVLPWVFHIVGKDCCITSQWLHLTASSCIGWWALAVVVDLVQPAFWRTTRMMFPWSVWEMAERQVNTLSGSDSNVIIAQCTLCNTGWWGGDYPRDTDTTVDEPPLGKVVTAIKGLGNGRAPGSDGFELNYWNAPLDQSLACYTSSSSEFGGQPISFQTGEMTSSLPCTMGNGWSQIATVTATRYCCITMSFWQFLSITTVITAVTCYLVAL